VFAGLAALKDRLPGILAFAGGADASPEGLQRGHTHAFTIDFADAAARDAYLADAGHKALGARLVAAARGGLDGITVVDFAG
jgi:Stress responsive A/B Barrel Domain